MIDLLSAEVEIVTMKFTKVVSVYKPISMLAALLCLGVVVTPAAQAQIPAVNQGVTNYGNGYENVFAVLVGSNLGTSSPTSR